MAKRTSDLGSPPRLRLPKAARRDGIEALAAYALLQASSRSFKGLAKPLRSLSFPRGMSHFPSRAKRAKYPPLPAACGRGGTGRRKGLKIPRWQRRVGSSPTARTTLRQGATRGAAVRRPLPKRVRRSLSEAKAKTDWDLRQGATRGAAMRRTLAKRVRRSLSEAKAKTD